jgi:uncharacterized repeat protein (TIGR02543 family)
VFAKHSLGGGKYEFLKVTVTGADSNKVATWQQSSFSEVELTTNANKGTIQFNDDSVSATIKYTAADIGTALPTATRAGYTFNGWTIDGISGTYTTMDETLLAAINNDTKTATASFTQQQTSNPTPTVKPTTTPSSSSDSDSSGGSGSSTQYDVSVSRPQNGTVKVDLSSATAGRTVTMTVSPNAGYQLDELTVTDSKGNTLNVKQISATKFTFVMPSGKVSVSATFAPTSTAAADPTHDFTDLVSTAWYHDAVAYALENGIMGGLGNGKFGPDDKLSRAMLAQILYNLEGSPASSGVNSFTDVPNGQWYTTAVTWAAKRGIVSGYGDGKFGPNDNITREQLAVMLWKYAGSPAAKQTSLNFTDAGQASDYALEALKWANENGIISGTGNGVLNPKGLATRAQVAQMLMNYLK